MTKDVELLAPAGDYESFIAAVQNGANAVYLGGKSFNARQNAGNFDNEELRSAVEYAHIRGVKVYLTLNTLLPNKEFKELSKFLLYAYSIGIDGLIVQDIGAAKFAKELLPDIKLHASTQMTIHNLEGVLELEKLGFERVVLSRELGIEEIKYICQNCHAEIEVFVHGALCMCYSGQCLMSSFIGGRSGNRGICAQPCRLPYTLASNSNATKGYILSPKDLCTIDYLDQIIESGVKSLKIEGRMKRPEYVATVVSKYRKYIDEYFKNKEYRVDDNDYLDLLQIYNRGGFTKDYLLGEKVESSLNKPNNWGVYLGVVQKFDNIQKTAAILLNQNLSIGDSIEFQDEDQYGTNVGKIIKNKQIVKSANRGDIIEIPVSQPVRAGIRVYKTSSIELLDRAKNSCRNENIKIDITGEFIGRLNSPAVLKIYDHDGNTAFAKSDIDVQKAISNLTTRDRIIEQLSKLGNTPYSFSNIDIEIDDQINIPISELNSLRREAADKLSELRILNSLPKSVLEDILDKSNAVLKKKSIVRNNNTKLSLYLTRVDKIEAANLGVDRLYIPITEYLKDRIKVLDLIDKNATDCEIYIALPRILRSNIRNSAAAGLDELQGRIDGVLASNIGHLGLINKDFKISADYGYNIFNNFAIEALENLNIKGVTLSTELNTGQIKELLGITDCQVELIVYGNIPLMITEFCPQRVGNKCNNCQNQYVLIDRLNNKFDIITDNITCKSEILNPKVLFLGEDIGKIISLKPNYIRLNITKETDEEIYAAINFHRDLLVNGNEALEKYKDYINKLKENYTKGHYFRGVG